eukprot:5760248-Pyramimonas_sp.AAC.1
MVPRGGGGERRHAQVRQKGRPALRTVVAGGGVRLAEGSLLRRVHPHERQPTGLRRLRAISNDFKNVSQVSTGRSEESLISYRFRRFAVSPLRRFSGRGVNWSHPDWVDPRLPMRGRIRIRPERGPHTRG